ncbi:hypothetical protein PoB_007402200 [Plakobranchus ocellatus]|uniref:Uncharacterized protein n=1 Tax=Plakobranchus ocellatus TaxID=259542 RepID=A0AAV4DT38_9GAST|nr:hypothetical protein PoB_007402200 [Plakobranchus ocellatus]
MLKYGLLADVSDIHFWASRTAVPEKKYGIETSFQVYRIYAVPELNKSVVTAGRDVRLLPGEDPGPDSNFHFDSNVLQVLAASSSLVLVFRTLQTDHKHFRDCTLSKLPSFVEDSNMARLGNSEVDMSVFQNVIKVITKMSYE